MFIIMALIKMFICALLLLVIIITVYYECSFTKCVTTVTLYLFHNKGFE